MVRKWVRPIDQITAQCIPIIIIIVFVVVSVGKQIQFFVVDRIKSLENTVIHISKLLVYKNYCEPIFQKSHTKIKKKKENIFSNDFGSISSILHILKKRILVNENFQTVTNQTNV